MAAEPDHSERTVIVRRDPLLGATFDRRFRVDAKIAAGGFGAIYRATHLNSGHEFALKMLHANLTHDPHVVARFRREGDALTRLRDPHTITAYELGEAPDGTLYIVMELLHGESLYDRFRGHGPMPWRRVMAIARAVCSSLAEAHAHGIIHRDLKPTNIHLEPRGAERDFVKVLDFGIAKILHGSEIDSSDLTQVGQMIGTLDYMSPEQMVGGMCTATSDIYTLGILMYEMIAGRKPFDDANSAAAALAAVLTTTPQRLSEQVEVPPSVDVVVMRCLERPQSERFQSAVELAAALDDILLGREYHTGVGRAEDDPTAPISTLHPVPHGLVGPPSRASNPAVAPSLSPQVAPQRTSSPQVAPQRRSGPSLSPQVSPQRGSSPQAAPQRTASPSISPSISPQVSPQRGSSPQAAPQRTASPSMSPSISPQVSPQRGSSPQQRTASPSISPQVAPQRGSSPQAAPQRISSPRIAPLPLAAPERESSPRLVAAAPQAAPAAPRRASTAQMPEPQRPPTPQSAHVAPHDSLLPQDSLLQQDSFQDLSIAREIALPAATPLAVAEPQRVAAPAPPLASTAAPRASHARLTPPHAQPLVAPPQRLSNPRPVQDTAVAVPFPDDATEAAVGSTPRPRLMSPRPRTHSTPLRGTPRNLREAYPTIHLQPPSASRPLMAPFDDRPTTAIGAPSPSPPGKARGIRHDPMLRHLALAIGVAIVMVAAMVVAGALQR